MLFMIYKVYLMFKPWGRKCSQELLTFALCSSNLFRHFCSNCSLSIKVMIWFFLMLQHLTPLASSFFGWYGNLIPKTTLRKRIHSVKLMLSQLCCVSFEWNWSTPFRRFSRSGNESYLNDYIKCSRKVSFAITDVMTLLLASRSEYTFRKR